MSAARRRPPAFWYGDAPPPFPARVASALYGGALALRERLGLPRVQRVSRPVIVVGNLIAGGSGKTPLAIALVERLRRQGWMPGVATRGYGRDHEDKPSWVEANTDPALGGDEPVLIARRTGARVRADCDRVAAARALIDAGCDIVVCDDGLQHRRLHRDVEIEVIDGRRRYGNGLLLPAGPLRERAERGERCDFRVVNGGEAGFGEWPMRLDADEALPMQGGRPRALADFAGRRVHAVAGIGDPERFFSMLRALGIAVVPHAFPDHHRYVAEELRFGNDLPILMTEKDAVKCAAFADERCWTVPAQARLPEAFWIALLDKLPPRTGTQHG